MARNVCTLRERGRNEAHVRLAVLGFGIDGQRPLLGDLVVSHEEFGWLANAFYVAQLDFDPTAYGEPADG